MTKQQMQSQDQAAERDKRMKAMCDEIVERAARLMVEDVRAPIPMMLDRMLTYAAAQACTIDGSANTAIMFREMADKIERGLFHRVTGENADSGRRH